MNKYLRKIANQNEDYIYLYHGTPESNFDSIRKVGLLTDKMGSNMGAWELLENKKVLSFSKNPAYARSYTAGTILEALFGKRVQPLIAKIPKNGIKEVSEDYLTNEYHVPHDIPATDVYFPDSKKYKEIENKYLQKIATTVQLYENKKTKQKKWMKTGSGVAEVKGWDKVKGAGKHISRKPSTKPKTKPGNKYLEKAAILQRSLVNKVNRGQQLQRALHNRLMKYMSGQTSKKPWPGMSPPPPPVTA